MIYPLIEAYALNTQLHNNTNLCIIDARFDLQFPDQGQTLFNQSHIPKAQYVHLNNDLSGMVIPNQTGRHPLPTTDAVEGLIRRLGITSTSSVVIYDQGELYFAARAWWILKWAGLKDVKVLNGGFNKWQQLALSTTQYLIRPKPSHYSAFFHQMPIVTSEQVLQAIEQPDSLLIDARTQTRFEGKLETMDSQGGHIPKAICYPYGNNFSQGGLLLDKKSLTKNWEPILKNHQPLIAYCGSGVTACVNILAISCTELPIPALYVGSWSEWITDAKRPIA